MNIILSFRGLATKIKTVLLLERCSSCSDFVLLVQIRKYFNSYTNPCGCEDIKVDKDFNIGKACLELFARLTLISLLISSAMLIATLSAIYISLYLVEFVIYIRR